MAVLTGHALARCSEMGLNNADIVETIRNPELTYPSAPRYGPGRMVSAKGSLAVVHTTTGTVITVLWHGASSRHPDWALGPLTNDTPRAADGRGSHQAPDAGTPRIGLT